MAGGSVTSTGTAIPPVSPATRSSSSAERAEIATRAPSCRNASAVTSPRPDDAPVTQATFPPNPRSTLAPSWCDHDLAEGLVRLHRGVAIPGVVQRDCSVDNRCHGSVLEQRPHLLGEGGHGGG